MTKKGPVVPLTAHQTPAAILSMGDRRLQKRCSSFLAPQQLERPDFCARGAGSAGTRYRTLLVAVSQRESMRSNQTS
ncbi:hypothetical protein OG599_04580 [Streptomyces sp. NBC_01335]|nr:hypothetical protein OG599_04580 [Streptomyces sp. NBC_01335]